MDSILRNLWTSSLKEEKGENQNYKLFIYLSFKFRTFKSAFLIFVRNNTYFGFYHHLEV